MASLLGLIPLVLLGGAGFLGAVAALSTRRTRFSERFLGVIGVLGPAVSFAFALALFLGIDASGGRVESSLWSWIKVGGVSVDLVFRADHLTVVMLLVITGIGTLIHVYSTGYMHGDPGFARYFACLNLFLFFMTILVLAGDLVVLFVGWEGVGLCSYLLIGFWWTDADKAQAGLKAFVVNRIGDAGFLLGMFLIWKMAGTLDLAKIHEKLQDGAFAAAMTADMGWLGASAATVAGLLLFLGATGKSAQIPLYVWLPDAMAGPTPVSALIHAATMVTAGVYMIARLNALYALSAAAQGVIVVVAAATCLIAAGMALVQNDIKKVLAYSTVSQLGYMFIGVGSGAIAAGVLHLITHAFFKACLFLGAGSIIHALHHEQDLRNMGGLRRPMRTTFRTMLIAALAMAGIPPLAGFFSKDEILWRAWESGGVGRLAWAVGSIAALGTAFYVFRLIFLAFGGSYRGSAAAGHLHGGASAIHESPRSMTVPLVVLAGGAILVGFLGVPHVLGGGDRLAHYLAPVLAHSPAAHAAGGSGAAMSVELALMVLTIAIAVLGVVIAHRFYVSNPALPGVVAGRFPVLTRRLVGLLGIDAFYEKRIVAPLRGFAERILAQRVDTKLIDAFVNGCGGVARRMARAVAVVQDGSIQNYLTWMVLGTLLLLLTLLA